MSTVTYGRLTPLARSFLSDTGVVVAAYIRYWFPDGQWRGDRCGCPDDRCIGYHHEDATDCGCIEALVVHNPPADAHWWAS